MQVVSVGRNHLIEALLVLLDSDKNDTRSDGLPSSIVSALSLATSGMGLTHSDIGGYTGLKTFGLNMNTMHWDDEGTWLEKSFIQLPILCANSQAVAFSVLWGRRSYFCVGQSTLYFPQSWEPMRFVSLLHEDTSDSPFQRLSWLLITEFHTRATNRSRSTNSTQTRTQCSSLVDSRKFSPPWKIIQRSPPHSSLNSKSL